MIIYRPNPMLELLQAALMAAALLALALIGKKSP